MWIYLDTNIVNAVENPSAFGPKALQRLKAISVSDRIAVSELTRMESCSFPLRSANFPLLRLFDAFFRRPDVTLLPLTDNVFRRALVIQAMNDIATVDCLHLATAAEHGCNVFLTNDNRLANFTDLTVEILA